MNEITIADFAREVGIHPKVARARMRNHTSTTGRAPAHTQKYRYKDTPRMRRLLLSIIG